MRRPKLVSLLISLCLLVGFYFALAAAQFTIQISITNPNSVPANNVITSFNFPSCLSPVTVGPNMTWDAGTGIFTVSLGTLAANETRVVALLVEATTSNCLASGSITGELSTMGAVAPPPPPVVPPSPAPAPPPGGGPAPAPGIIILPGPLDNLGEQLRSNPTVVAVQEIAAPISAAVGVISAAAVATNVVTTGYSVIVGWLHLVRYFFFFVSNKKRPAWGVVYNEWTKKPIAGAAVSIVESIFRKIKETQITDREGRFGFLVAPGSYSLRILKPGFDARETALFAVGTEPEKLNLQIGLVESKGFLAYGKAYFRRSLQGILDFINLINPYALAVGTLLSLFVFVVTPTNLNLVFLLVYLMLDIIKLAISLRSVRSYGVVIDKSTGAPLALSVVRLFDVDKNLLIGTRVSNEQGRFNFLLLPGQYYLTCAKESYGELRTDVLQIKKEAVVSQMLEMTPLAPPPPLPPAPFLAQ